MKQMSQGHRLRNMTKSIILKTEKLIHEYHGKHSSGPLVDVADYEELLVDDYGAQIEGPGTNQISELLKDLKDIGKERTLEFRISVCQEEFSGISFKNITESKGTLFKC